MAFPIYASGIRKIISATASILNKGKWAGIGCDTSDSFQLKFNKNGTVKTIADSDNVLSLAGAAPLSGAGANKVAVFSLVGTTIHAGPVGWANPEAGSIIVNRVDVVTSVVATGAGGLDVGTTAVSAATASDVLIDGADVHTALGVFDNITNKGSNGKSVQQLATGKWVTFSDDGTGDTTGMVGKAYIFYTIQ